MLQKSIAKLRFGLIDMLGNLSIQKVFAEMQIQQFESCSDLEKRQLEKLNALIKTASEQTVFYRGLKEYVDFDVLNKEIIRANYNDFKAETFKDKLYTKATGGSTGKPLVYLTTSLSRSYMWAGIMLSWTVAGYELGDKVAFIAGSALIDASGTYKRKLFYALFNIKIYSAFSLDETYLASYIHSIKQEKIRIIYGYASAIDKIAHYIRNNGDSDFPLLKGIICTSEVLTPQMRKNIEAAFKVKVFNQYGCNEAGVSAFECEHKQMHLINTRCYQDVDKDGSLRSTDLTNEGYILLKYETGDYVKMSAQRSCECKRGFPIIEQVVGRKMDLVIDKEHHILHGSFFYYLFRNDSSIQQYQISFDKNNIYLYLNVDGSIHPAGYYNRYLEIVKQYLHFDAYYLKLNTGFLLAKNAKHLHVVNLDIQTPAPSGV